MNNNYLESAIKQLEYYKLLGEKTISQIPDEKLFVQFNEESNSIAIIVKHLWGNMLSRWSDFLTTDGEKEWRNRDGEFDSHFHGNDDFLVAYKISAKLKVSFNLTPFSVCCTVQHSLIGSCSKYRI